MLAWQIWIVIGIICIIIEIFDPAFFFLSLGSAAIVTGLLSFAVRSTALQIIIFAVLSLAAFLSMRRLGRKVLKVADQETNVYALKGKTGKVVKAIPEHGKGYVKIGGEEWSAIEENSQAVELGAKVIITGLDGNKVIVKRQTPENPS